MRAELISHENNKAIFNVEVGYDKFETAMEKSYRKNRGRFNIDGFRKGKAPRKIIELNYGEEVFYEEAINIMLPEIYEYSIKELDLEPVDRPEIDVDNIDKDQPIIFKFEVLTKPDPILGDYKNLEMENIEYEVTDEIIDGEISVLRDQNARIVEVEDRKSKDGDILSINFKGFVGEDQFEGGTAENQELTLGSNAFIPGFEEQLLDQGKGDKVDVKVTFPEDYHEESLKGKEAIFKVEINSIKEKQLPDLDDEFAKDISEFDTLEELKNSIKEKKTEEFENTEKIEKENKVVEMVVELSQVDIPEIMIEDQVNNEINDFQQRLQMQGLELDKYMEITNMTQEKLAEDFRPIAEKRVKADLVLEKIAKVEKIEVNDEDIDQELENFAKQYNQEDVDKFKSDMKKGDLSFLETGIIRRKTLEYLLSNVKYK